jgi:hypothetical protein
VSDFDLVLRINAEIKADGDRPILDQVVDPRDEVSVELLCFEADNLIDTYMQQYRTKYAGQFEKPEVFEALVEEYRKVMRRNVRKFVMLVGELMEMDEDGEGMDGDGI